MTKGVQAEALGTRALGARHGTTQAHAGRSGRGRARGATRRAGRDAGTGAGALDRQGRATGRRAERARQTARRCRARSKGVRHRHWARGLCVLLG